MKNGTAGARNLLDFTDMRHLLALVFIAAMPGFPHAQPSGWAASSGASAPEAPGPVIEITRPVNSRDDGNPAARPGEAPCEIKPVMSDADYRRCNARPPSYDVDFAAPWPADKPVAGQRRSRS